MSDLYISWDEYNKKIEQLAIQVYKDGWKFNQTICIAKGGLRVGDVLSRLFDVPLAILSVESYHGGSGDIKNQQGQFTFSRDLAKTTPNLGSHVLLIDDLADSGMSIGSHSVNHYDMLNLSKKDRMNELINSKN